MNIFTAQAEAFRKAMAGGQQAASAPRFSDPKAPDPADDHGGMTHKCDGCSDGAPCGSCGGNVSKKSAAYQALQWGMMQAASNETLDPFWRAAAVAQTLQDAPGRTDSADWTAIQSMVRRTQALYTVGTQGMNAAGALVGAWDDNGPLFSADDDGGMGGGPVVTEDEEHKNLVAQAKDYLSLHHPSSAPFTGRICCPKLYYPLDVKEPEFGPVFPGIGLGHNSARQIRREFTFGAEYSNKLACSCKCCVFFQLILTNVVVQRDLGEMPDTSLTGWPFKDEMENLPRYDNCDYLIKKDGVVTKVTVPWGTSPRELVGMKPEDWSGPYCYGDVDPPPPPAGTPVEIMPQRPPNACIWSDNDRPGKGVTFGYSFAWKWESWGIVWDRCLDQIALIKFLTWTVTGKVHYGVGVPPEIDAPPEPGKGTISVD